ncbi:MAG: DUF4147 domain-containing protein [bacterium]
MSSILDKKPFADLNAIFRAALDRVDPYTMIRSCLSHDGNHLTIATEERRETVDLDQFAEIIVLGFGKASARMALAVEEILRDRGSESVLRHLDEGPETPKPGDPVFDRAVNMIIGSNHLGLLAALARMRPEDAGIYLLFGASDGNDGPTDAAGGHASWEPAAGCAGCVHWTVGGASE